MIFTQMDIPGTYIIDLEKIEDDRGYFARSFCQQEFENAGISFTPVQTNLSFNKQAGTLRGMHYQQAPHGEAKLVRCNRGRIFDVAIDLRPESAAYRQWIGVELDADDGRALFIPEGCAHGFLTLSDDTEVLYLMGHEYVPGAGAGVRWDDPAFSIAWPANPVVISDRDRAYALV